MQFSYCEIQKSLDRILVTKILQDFLETPIYKRMQGGEVNQFISRRMRITNEHVKKEIEMQFSVRRAQPQSFACAC